MLHVPHPNIDEFEVMYLSEGESLDDLDPEFLRHIDPASKAFFLNKQARMEQLLSGLELESARRWYERLFRRKLVLAVMTRGKLNAHNDGGGSYLLFQDDQQSFLHKKEWPHEGSALDVEVKMYNPNHYPAELLNIIKPGCPHFSYWYAGAKLVKPGDDNLVKNNELISELVEQSGAEDLDMSSLRFLYDDYSGSNLFYDAAGTIWFGGYEEGDFAKTNFTMREALDSIFSAHLAQEFPRLTEIAEGKYL